MNKKDYEGLLTYAMSTGADFAEVFYENSKTLTYSVFDSKLDNIATKNMQGIGIRIYKDNNCYYASTNSLDFNSIKKIITKIIKKFNNQNNNEIKLSDLIVKKTIIKVPHDKLDINQKKEILLNIDKKVREHSSLVTQVSLGFLEIDREFVIANSNGKFIKSDNCLTRFICSVYTERDGVKEREFTDYAQGKGYEILEEVDILERSLKAADIAIEKLDAINFKGGELPVVIASGFGAVIFHEACGHGLEATSVAPKLSIFSDDLGKVIASKKVTLIDDGTIPNAWGSNLIDDEGNEPQRNILIEKGVLKTFLVDDLNSKKMNQHANGCSRRENYNYAPTSRMSNTYLAPGKDKVEDMIKSIKLGVYCERMSGGSVNPATGEFNFAVETARLIENGKLSNRIKGITLIGTSKEILKNVEMVSDDLVLSGGYCGSKSGTIYVTIGQPTIKVSRILVGGKE